MTNRTFIARWGSFSRIGLALLSAALMTLLLLPRTAAASSISAATCALDAATLTPPANFQFGANGSIDFAYGTGDITLRCNIPNFLDSATTPPNGTWFESFVTYWDDSSSPDDYVKVTLHQTNKLTAADTTEELASSQYWGFYPSAWNTIGHNLATAFDFSTNRYFITIQLHRESTSATVKALTIVLL